MFGQILFFFWQKVAHFFQKKFLMSIERFEKLSFFPFFFQTDCKDYVFPNNSIQTKKSLIFVFFYFFTKMFKKIMFLPIILSKRKYLEFFRFLQKYFKDHVFPNKCLGKFCLFFLAKSGTFFSKKVFDVHRKIWKTILFPFFFSNWL